MIPIFVTGGTFDKNYSELTGAMVPYAFGSSDGLFNLGSALSFVQVLPPGAYVAMNGRYFLWDRVRKNRETGVFEALPQAPGPHTSWPETAQSLHFRQRHGAV